MQLIQTAAAAAPVTVPRLAFVGLGWIGLHRMKALIDTGTIEVAGIADPTPQARNAAAALAPDAVVGASLDEVLATRPDGVVIATPSAMHAKQSIAALDAGAAVFCQKPLGRNAIETAQAVTAAKLADRLLATDLSYRQVTAFRALRDLVRSGELGDIYAVDLVFHNAYGPDKPWFLDRQLSGGGCLMDLGIHLADLALWTLGGQELACRSAYLRAHGAPLVRDGHAVEDFAAATMETESGAMIRLACSWYLPAGRDAAISMEVYGTDGGACVTNVDGSFYDFAAYRYRGTATECLVEPPDEWGGRAAAEWASQLAAGARYDPGCESLVTLAETLDGIYSAADAGG